jgi:hypothetical protein
MISISSIDSCAEDVFRYQREKAVRRSGENEKNVSGQKMKI